MKVWFLTWHGVTVKQVQIGLLNENIRGLISPMLIPQSTQAKLELNVNISWSMTSNQLMVYPERTKIQVLAPIARGKKGEFQKTFEQLKKSGYVRVRVDGEMRELEDKAGSISILLPKPSQAGQAP